MEQLKIFENSEFGSVRTIEENGEVLFCGKDVAEALGYGNTKDAILRHCKGVVKRDLPTNGGIQEINFIPEGDVYRLIARSQLPEAKRFERWVFDEVIPSVRKTGVYIAPTVDRQMMFKIAAAMREKERQIVFLESEAARNKPLVAFAEKVSMASNSISVGDFAKLLCDEQIPIGRNRLFQWFKDNGYLQSDNIPYQRYIDAGYFEVIEQPYNKPYKQMVSVKTLITGKGQIYFTEKMRKVG